MPFCSESEVERLLAIPTPPLSPVSPTSYLLPPFFMPLPIFTLVPPPPIIIPRTRASMALMRSFTPSTFILAPRSESIPEADIPLRKRARFTTPTGGYEIGESYIAAAVRQIRPTLTIAKSHRADDRLISRLRRERQYFHTLSTTYAQEVAYSRDYCTQIMKYCQSREVHTSTLVSQIEALQRDKIAPKRARTTRANPDPTRTTTVTQPMTQEAINNLIAQRVAEALAEYKTQRNSVVNEDTSNTTRTGPRTVCPTRECTYKDYLNYGSLKFNGTEGVIVSQEVAYTMPWRTLKQMTTAKYCPRGKVKKLEVELWKYHQLYSSFPRVNSIMRENVSRRVRRDRKICWRTP
nr:hypothetical protein [Tanacetum cinerariifolium]